MSNVLKISGPIKVGSLASAPANPEVGYIYYDTTAGKYQQYDGTQFVEPADLSQLSSTATGKGASLVSIEDAATQFTSTNVEGALTESLDAAQAAQVTADSASSGLALHENGGPSKHAGTEIDYSRLDASKKNIQATSDDVESALSDLDDAVGTLNQGTNYTATDATAVGSHLDAIDTALATAGGTEFADDVFRVTGNLDATKKVALEADGLTTATTRTITMPDANVNLGDIATNNAKVSADGLVTTHSDVTSAGSGAIITSTERSKLTGIEALADVTDAINVEAAGAVMESDTTTLAMGFVVDEDTMVSNLATKVPTQQSVKAYVDTEVASAITSAMTFKGNYDAATNTPDLDTTPIATSIGDTYVVTAAGNFFSTPVEIGDQLMAKQNSATLETHWSIVQANLTAATIKTQYESNLDTNAYTDAEKTLLGNQSGVNTGDEVSASTTVQGIIEIATQTEVNAGTDTARALNPSTFANSSQLAAKLGSVSEDTAPALGGDLTLGANAVIHDAAGMKRGSSALNFLEEEYIHAITLAASQTNAVITELTFAHASFEGLEMTYKMKEATSNNVRIGTVRVVTNGTNVVLSEVSTESANLGVSFSAVVNGANINIRYTSDTNAVTMRADVKRFLA